MKEKLLLSIANTVYLNSYRAGNAGFISGQLGICLFLYHFARYKGDAIYITYGELADVLIDSLVENLRGNTSPDFDTGLSGLVFGIGYLIDNGFIEGDPDEIFSEIDEMMFEALSRESIEADISSHVSFFSAGLYAVTRKNRVQAERIFEEYCRFAPDIKGRPSLNYLNSLLWFLNNLWASGSRIDQDELSRLFETVNGWLTDSVDRHLYDHSDIIVFKRLLRKGPSEIVRLINIKHRDTLKAVTPDDYKDIFHNLGWKSLVFGQSHRFEDYIPANFQLNSLLDVSPTARITVELKDGLSGLGLTLMINSI